MKQIENMVGRDGIELSIFAYLTAEKSFRIFLDCAQSLTGIALVSNYGIVLNYGESEIPLALENHTWFSAGVRATS